MLRRRFLIPQKSNEKWDINWNYTMGELEKNGFDRYEQGAVKTFMSNDGFHLKSERNANDYVRYNPIKYPQSSYEINIVEVVFAVLIPTMGNNGFRVLLGSESDFGNHISINNDTLYYAIEDGRQIPLASVKTNEEHKVRLEYYSELNKKNKVYFDDVELKITGIKSKHFTTFNRIFQQGIGEVVLKEIRYKFE